MQYYSYVTENPCSPNWIDEPVGTSGRSIDRDRKTLRGVVNLLKKACVTTASLDPCNIIRSSRIDD
jgi:hypothetical protein